MNPQSASAASKEMLTEPLQKIFIATSTEALETDWLTNALELARDEVKGKHPDVDLRLWTDEFEPGEVTAERLIEVAADYLGAIVILTGDDFLEERGTSTAAPRDNLILETGLFLARTGLQNVLPLREKGSKWPSDLLGVNFKEFSPSVGNESSGIVARGISRSIAKFVDRLMKTRTSTAGRAFLRSSARAMQAALDLKARLYNGASDEPIDFPYPSDAYLDAITEVNERFITTTYLKSDFWTSTGVKFLYANQEMLKRINEAEGIARRVILLEDPLDLYLEAQRKERRALRTGNPKQVLEMDRAFDRLAKRHRDLTEAGFEVRVVYDRDQAYSQLPPEVSFELLDTELALYDDSRLDIFTGFTANNLPAVQTYSKGHFEGFPVLSKQVDAYFKQLWNSSDEAYEFEDFAGRVEVMIRETNREIDYTSNWLYSYDNARGEDRELKQAESDFVRGQLAKRQDEVLIDGHIDLGTCTGRYLRELSPLVGGTKIFGIDNDEDCIDVLKARKESGELDSRVEIVEADIRRRKQLPPGPFGLVTCMMGTMCHLERDEADKDQFKDEWQIGLENVKDLLASDGDAFIAVWDEQVCARRPRRKRKLLSIYEPRDSTILCDQAPPERELQARMKQAGLEIAESDVIKNRLRVFHLRHDGGED